MTTVKETKEKLNELVSRLNEFDDAAEVVMWLDDNCGGSYPAELCDFSVSASDDGKKVVVSNFIC